MLFKSDDAAARPADVPDILVDKPNSAATGRTMDAIARDQDRVWASGQGEITQPAKKRRRRKSAVDPTTLTKAKAGALPGFIEPTLPSPTDRAPSGRGWLHEIKHDGYRLQAHLENGRATLFSRQGLDWTERFPALAHALADLPVKVAIVDGEAVVHAETGVASFTALVDALKSGRGDMVFYAFDLLYLDGFDLRQSPLGERKAALAEIMAGDSISSRLRYSEHIEGDGDAVFRHAALLGLEGIISKMASSPYQSGRVKTWLKLKSSHTDSFVIAGFIPSTVDKAAVSALVLGEYAGKKLVPVGHVGSGFTSASARELRQRLEPLRTGTPPLEDETADAKGVRWVEPVLWAEIEYRGRTGSGLIRHAVFRELVEGKTSPSQPREATPTERKPRSKAASDPALPVRLTNPGRLLWPEQGITKQGLAEFHAEIADWILPHIVGRPLSLLRCPEGIAAQCFFQKHAWAGLGGAVRQVAVPSDEQRMLVVDDLSGLLELVQASVLEIHPWGALADRPELPDRVTIDLDPDDTVPWQRVIDAAHEVRRRLQASRLPRRAPLDPAPNRRRGRDGPGASSRRPAARACTWSFRWCRKPTGRASRRSPSRSLRPWPPSSRLSTPTTWRRASAAAASTSTTCATAWAPPPSAPTRRAPATAHRSRCRSTGTSSARTSAPITSPSSTCPIASPFSTAIPGRISPR